MEEKHGIDAKITAPSADPGLFWSGNKTENLETMIRELTKEKAELTEKNIELAKKNVELTQERKSLKADLEAERQALKEELKKANDKIDTLKDAIAAEYVDRWARRGGGGPEWP